MYHCALILFFTLCVISTNASQMEDLVKIAQRAAGSRRPHGRCYEWVAKYIDKVGYGNIKPGNFDNMIPSTHWAEARQFGQYANKNLEKLGLTKLPLNNPYKAPRGAIVVVRAGTPGTRHPTAGDIVVAGGDGKFYNDGLMGYGGSSNFPEGNTFVIGIYVPTAEYQPQTPTDGQTSDQQTSQPTVTTTTGQQTTSRQLTTSQQTRRRLTNNRQANRQTNTRLTNNRGKTNQQGAKQVVNQANNLVSNQDTTQVNSQVTNQVSNTDTNQVNNQVTDQVVDQATKNLGQTVRPTIPQNTASTCEQKCKRCLKIKQKLNKSVTCIAACKCQNVSGN